MTILAFDGFETYSDRNSTAIGMGARWILNGSVALASTVTGRFGGQAMRYNNTTATVKDQLDLGANQSSVAFGIALKPSTVTGDWGAAPGEALFGFLDSANALQIQFNMDSNGNIIVRRGGTVTIATGDLSRVVKGDIYSYLEAEVVFSDTVGTVKVWLDNVLIINATALDTVATAIVSARYFYIGLESTHETFIEFDDLYVTDGTRLGERRIVQSVPTADTAVKDFTPSSGGTNALMVDELTPNTDTDYVQASTVGNKDYYDMTDVPASMDVVDAVTLYAYMRKTDAGSREMRANIKSNTDVVSSANLILNATYGCATKLQVTDPQGGGAWTVARMNALQIGQEIMV